MSSQSLTIEELPIGSRILYRSKENWRTAAISRKAEEFVTLTVCSPKGRTYRLRRKGSAEVLVEGSLAILISEPFPEEYWKDNYGKYDQRW